MNERRWSWARREDDDRWWWKLDEWEKKDNNNKDKKDKKEKNDNEFVSEVIFLPPHEKATNDGDGIVFIGDNWRHDCVGGWQSNGLLSGSNPTWSRMTPLTPVAPDNPVDPLDPGWPPDLPLQVPSP